MAGLGTNLRAAREAARLSLSAMAARTHYSKALLGLLETGRRRVTPEHVAAYSRVLGVSLDVLYGPAEEPLRVAHEWLVADSPAYLHRGSGRRVGPRLADELQLRAAELRHLDDVMGSGALLPVVRRELASARELVVSATYDEPTGRRLLTLVGELAQLAGWVASDAGRYIEAQRLYLAGVSAAREGDNRVLAGQLLSSLSYQMANVGEPAEAALLTRSAVKGAHGATPVVTALLQERVAWASARCRDREGAMRALDAVDTAYERRSSGIPEPEWVYWLDRREIDVMAGRCLIELGDPVRAEPLLSAAIADYRVEHAREVALYRSWLAESYAKAGVFDAARETIGQARRAANAIDSVRLDLRISQVERLLQLGTNADAP